MNHNHALLCSTPRWAEHLHTKVLAELIEFVQLGERMLEVGPGPGAATGFLLSRVAQLVAVELDEQTARRLRDKYAGAGIVVVRGDATQLPFRDGFVDSAGSFTMLHHISTPTLQNRLLAEILRVLRPGGVLVGSDSLPSDELHHFHEGDTYDPVDPAGLFGRLQTLGYERITVSADDALTFRAYKPR